MNISKIKNIYRIGLLQIPHHWIHFCLDFAFLYLQQAHVVLSFHEILILFINPIII